jgi:hypothetical protein
MPLTRFTLCYARVSSHDQKEDLKKQIAVLESFCAARGWTYEILQDLGWGLNYHKKGLKKLIKAICSGSELKSDEPNANLVTLDSSFSGQPTNIELYENKKIGKPSMNPYGVHRRFTKN